MCETSWFHVSPARSTAPLSLFIAVVGIEVEVGDDFRRLIRRCLKSISLEECISNRLNGVKFELVGEISTDGVGVR